MRPLAEVCAELLIFQSSIILKFTVFSGKHIKIALSYKIQKYCRLYYSDIFVKWQVFPFIKNGLLTNFKAKNATAPAASRFHYAAGEMAGFYCALITLLDKAYMLADLFVNFFFPFIKYNLIFLKQVSSLCINGYDQWSEFLNTAVP